MPGSTLARTTPCLTPQTLFAQSSPAKIACLQEIAYENGWMTKNDVRDSVQDMLKTEYGQYLLRLIEE